VCVCVAETVTLQCCSRCIINNACTEQSKWGRKLVLGLVIFAGLLWMKKSVLSASTIKMGRQTAVHTYVYINICMYFIFVHICQ